MRIYVHTETTVNVHSKTVTAGEDMEQHKVAFTAGGNAKWCSLFGEGWQFFKMLTRVITQQFSTPRFILKRNEIYILTQKHIHKCLSSLIAKK